LKQNQAQVQAEKLCKSFEEVQTAPDLVALERTIHSVPITSDNTPFAEEAIQDWEVDQALHRVKVKSCPGPDNLKVHTILRLWYHPKWKPQLLLLMNALYKDPALFSPFKHAIIFPVPKPGKIDAFRPISLLSQLGKILERVIAQRLQIRLDTPNQFGCTPHKSTKDALIRLQHWAARACHGAISIFFDVSKAYDRVIPKIVVQKLLKIPGISSRMASWIGEFLQNRTFQVRINGLTSSTIGRPKFGLPQGSPLSVVLWKVFASDIPIGRDDNMFMDDLNYNIDEPSYEEAEEVANEKLHALDCWARENGVLFDKEKTKVLVHETCTEVHLKFNAADTKSIPLVSRYKYLGTWLHQRNGIDSGFSLDTQFKHEARDFSRRLAWLRCLWHAPIYIRRTAYLALIRAKLSYSLLLTIRNYSEELEKMQTKALRIVAQAPDSTPGERLRYVLNIPSCLALAKAQAIVMRANMYAFGGVLAKDYEDWIEKEEGIDSTETPFGLIQSESLVTHEDLHFHAYRLVETEHFAALSQIRFQEIDTDVAEADPQTICCYTDGSFKPDGNLGGTGVFFSPHPAGVEEELSIHFRYFPAWNSYNCELLALRDALQTLHTFSFERRTKASKLCIFTDCLSLITSLAGLLHAPRSQLKAPLLVETLDLLTSLVTLYRITFSWIKGHAGTYGNEQADLLAKDATESGMTPTRSNFVDISFFRAQANLIQRPLPPDGFPVLPRFITRAIVNQQHPRYGVLVLRLICKHYSLKGCHFHRTLAQPNKTHRKRLRKTKSPQLLPTVYACRFCSEEPETATHIVDRCTNPEVEAHRLTLRGKIWHARPAISISLLHQTLSSPSTWPSLANFFSSLNLRP
jgi:ribonuclease HI